MIPEDFGNYFLTQVKNLIKVEKISKVFCCYIYYSTFISSETNLIERRMNFVIHDSIQMNFNVSARLHNSDYKLKFYKF
jgi:hypothetical protein